MTAPSVRPLWASRTVALLAIALLALNLRTAVAALSPIVDLVSRDVPIGAVGFGVLGTLPPIAFAAAGILAPPIARRIGIETTMALACLAMIVGPLVRAVAPNYPVLLLGSAVAFAGMGFGNILLPPAVKEYFPDRIGPITATYATIMSIGAALPPLVATPVAEAVGWRVSAGSWAVLAIGALVPWLVVALRARRRARDAGAVLLPEPARDLMRGMAFSRTAVALAIAFSMTALNAYAFFAWLPQLLVDRAGMTHTAAGALLSLFAITGLPLSLVAPLLAARVRNVGLVIWFGVGCFLVGELGLLLVPTTLPWLWVLFAGVGAIIFPLCLALIGLRSRGPEGAVALSGFVQAIGYASGALGPLVVGVLHDLTSRWEVSLLFLLATVLVGIIPALLLRRPSFVEDELAEASS